MYSIARFRRWLAGRAFGFQSTDAGMVTTAEPRPRLSVTPLENRLLPGDILLAAVAGLRGLETLGADAAAVRTIDDATAPTGTRRAVVQIDAPVNLAGRAPVAPTPPAERPRKAPQPAFDWIAVPAVDA